MKWLSRGITCLLALLLFFMITVTLLSRSAGGEPMILGHQLKTVLSGSMEPKIQTGSIIAVKPGGDMTQLREGQIITFRQVKNAATILVTHRIVKAVPLVTGQTQYVTKGDNNDGPDPEPVLSDNVTAVYSGFTVPYAGYFLDFARSKSGTALMMILPGLLLLGYSILNIWKGLKSLELPSHKEVPPVG
ncbi:signal peptidase I SipW [Paenibacillus mesotrionivorans]|jgi:signal peptidase|uniref:Signal peptidase I SipW n=1 Tax=Paenibacillus mesotrionivorans TaxID=3160968 RepID=A0ACC7NSQ3_9BACL